METITSTTMYKPSFHKHPLFFSARVVVMTICHCCGIRETIYGGYYCNDPNCSASFFHKKCAEAPLEINTPSHPQHPLRLRTNDSPYNPCDICGQGIGFSYYNCSTCRFKVHLTCGMKPSPPTIKHPLCHHHPLAFVKKLKRRYCEVCEKYFWGLSYICHECHIYFHIDCVNLSQEVNHHCHPNHPIKLIASKKLLDDAEKTCLSCKEQPDKFLYHCYICNFSICLVCTKNPPPLVIGHKKTHIHPLTLFSKKISFTCDVCGEEDKSGPYVCIQCAFITHGECIDLPRVININRHNHQISFTHHLGGGYSKCGVCHKNLSKYHGAYSCSLCTKYAVHCRCAVRDDVWDLIELEGIPNHDTYTAPFKVVGNDLIIHFSHEKHPLKFYKNNKTLYDKWLRCEACRHPLGLESIYGCEECGFILHEKCANLSMKKKNIFSPAPYSLEVVGGFVIKCDQCKVLFDGFMYTGEYMSRIDVHCSSLTEPFVHDGHLHPLYFDRQWGSKCVACENPLPGDYRLLRCDACKFNLCLYCATLPLKMWHRNDDHPITLHCGVKMSIESWCDICEREVDHCKWFYTCSDCEVTFHTRCLLGDFSRLKPEKLISTYRGDRYEVV